jgi:hypothetical protein
VICNETEIQRTLRISAVERAPVRDEKNLKTKITMLRIKVMKMFMDIRVDKAEEADGLDLAEHGEQAYPAFNGLD